MNESISLHAEEKTPKMAHLHGLKPRSTHIIYVHPPNVLSLCTNPDR